MTRDERVKLIQEIENKRKSKVIAYITSDRPGLSAQISYDALPFIHKHILALSKEERVKLDLLLYSRGGHSDTPWALVSMFREYSAEGSFSVLIPYRAHSAATVISLGADEIVMTKKAELGPIDITMGSGPYNPTEKDSNQRLPISVEDVTGYFSLLEKIGCVAPSEKMKGFELLTNNVHPLALGTVSRLLEETKLVALRLLSTRAEPFTEEQNHEIVKRISSEVYSHEHAISRTEARKYIGLQQVKDAGDAGIADELWALYEAYEALFDLNNPFASEEHLIVNDLEEHTWKDLCFACIESVNRLDMFRQDLQVRRLRQVPPSISLNLSNINIPAINIASLPPGIDQQQLNMIAQQAAQSVIQQLLSDASRIAAEQFVKSLPQAGFEHFAFNAGWRQEV